MIVSDPLRTADSDSNWNRKSLSQSQHNNRSAYSTYSWVVLVRAVVDSFCSVWDVIEKFCPSSSIRKSNSTVSDDWFILLHSWRGCFFFSPTSIKNFSFEIRALVLGLVHRFLITQVNPIFIYFSHSKTKISNTLSRFDWIGFWFLTGHQPRSDYWYLIVSRRDSSFESSSFDILDSTTTTVVRSTKNQTAKNEPAIFVSGYETNDTRKKSVSEPAARVPENSSECELASPGSMDRWYTNKGPRHSSLVSSMELSAPKQQQ